MRACYVHEAKMADIERVRDLSDLIKSQGKVFVVGEQYIRSNGN